MNNVCDLKGKIHRKIILQIVALAFQVSVIVDRRFDVLLYEASFEN